MGVDGAVFMPGEMSAAQITLPRCSQVPLHQTFTAFKKTITTTFVIDRTKSPSIRLPPKPSLVLGRGLVAH